MDATQTVETGTVTLANGTTRPARRATFADNGDVVVTYTTRALSTMSAKAEIAATFVPNA